MTWQGQFPEVLVHTSADLDCFEGFLVSYDEPCSREDIPQYLDQQSQEREAQTKAPKQQIPLASPALCGTQRLLRMGFKKPQQAKPSEERVAYSLTDCSPAARQKEASSCASPERRTGLSKSIHYMLPSNTHNKFEPDRMCHRD